MKVFCSSTSGISSSSAPSSLSHGRCRPPNPSSSLLFTRNCLLGQSPETVSSGGTFLFVGSSPHHIMGRWFHSSSDHVSSSFPSCRALGSYSAWCDTRAAPLVSHHSSQHRKHLHGMLLTYYVIYVIHVYRYADFISPNLQVDGEKYVCSTTAEHSYSFEVLQPSYRLPLEFGNASDACLRLTSSWSSSSAAVCVSPCVFRKLLSSTYLTKIKQRFYQAGERSLRFEKESRRRL
jgi:hypothetical protein